MDMTLVDLSTTDKEFEDIMLKEYPDTIFEEQHQKNNSDAQNKVYCFCRLNYAVLFGFLSKHRDNYEFGVYDAEKGELIEINKLNKACKHN